MKSGSSGSSGPAVPEEVEESGPVKKLVAPIAPNSNRPRRAHGQWACSVQNLVSRCVASDVVESVSIVAGGRQSTIPAIATLTTVTSERT